MFGSTIEAARSSIPSQFVHGDLECLTPGFRRAPTPSTSRALADLPGTRRLPRPGRSKSAPSSPSSGCHRTPSAKRCAGSSTASIVPSSAHAVATSPSPTRPNPWWWLDLTGTRSPDDRTEARARLNPTSWSENSPRRSLCRSSPTTSGRCWTRSPPRATFRIWLPRQTASTGMSRASAASSSASSARSRSARTPTVVRVWLCAVHSRDRGRRRRRSSTPSSASSVSSTPASDGGTSSAPATRLLHRAHVAERDQRRRQVPLRPTSPARRRS